jgi:sulfate transport system permease protein
MANTLPVSTSAPERPYLSVRVLTEPALVRGALILLAATFLGLVVVFPVLSVFAQAFAQGPWRVVEILGTPETLAAIKLTLLVAAIVVPLNVVFGTTAAWLIAKHRFRGKALLLSLIDLPLTVSPVISGLIFVLLFGGRSAIGQWLGDHGLPVIFAVPGIVLVTLFITFPLVVREVLPTLQASGNDEEEAALTLGASGWRIFFQITVPKIKWGLLYGIILCNARTMGEFGAVSVVSGHIRGLTNTMPLQVEILYNEYDLVGAFSLAALLTLLAVVTIVGKKVLERQPARSS